MRASYSQTGSENILSVARSRERTRVYNEARERADSLIQAAGLEGLDATAPVLASEEEIRHWWMQAFGCSEAELIDGRSAFAKRYRRLRLRPSCRQRREVLRSYILVDGLLMSAYGIDFTV
jgi:hypothetical protein